MRVETALKRMEGLTTGSTTRDMTTEVNRLARLVRGALLRYEPRTMRHPLTLTIEEE